jgi:hypothetical protein
MAFWNPATWKVVDNIQGQNNQPSTGGGGSWGGISLPTEDFTNATNPSWEGALTQSYQNGSTLPPGSYPQNTTAQNTGPSQADIQAQQQQAAANSQISQVDRLLGTIGAQRDAGQKRIETSYSKYNNRLTGDKNQSIQDYEDQFLENDKARAGGLDQVDNYANSSYNSLQRILQGANAGNSSLGRELVPTLVSGAAGERRKNVFDTAGENTVSIKKAKKSAMDQYDNAFEDLKEQKGQQMESFLTGLNQQEMDLLAQKLGFQKDAGIATTATESALNQKAETLKRLFGQFTPTFKPQSVKAYNPELGKYQVDPMQIKLGQSGLPEQQRYYYPQIKKKEQL